MGTLKAFFKDTFVYGLATVLPRLMNFLLVPLHTATLETESYSDNTVFYVYAAFFNVLLTYGMETAFFRFFNKHADKGKVYTTALTALTTTTLLVFAWVYFNKAPLADLFNLKESYFSLLIGVLALDTLVVAPFAYLRATGKSKRFAWVKLSNIGVYVALNFFFLWAVPRFEMSFAWYDTTDLVQYIFVANLLAAGVTLLLLSPYLFKRKWQFDPSLFRQMLRYGWPVMVAGLSYIVIENFDKWILPSLMGKEVNGAYSGCYKIAVFMMIFIQGFRLGAEPFFFSHAKEKDAPKTYAAILKYFVILGCLMLVFITAFIDFFKELIVRDEAYWMALDIVPIILLANLFFGIYFNLAVWYKLTDKTRYGMYFTLLGAGITLVFNLVLIPHWGFMAAAWGTLAAYLAMAVLSYFVGKKHYPVPYNTGRIGTYLLLASGFSALAYLPFKGNFWIGCALVLIFTAVVVFWERKEIRGLLRRRVAP